jgi:CheY-like chemotaxis protein
MPPKILIIEDEEFLVDMYKMKFKSEGYKVMVAYNGEDGIRVAREQKPDLILLDLVMPKMDGYQVLKELKSNNTTKDLKVYILSNLGQNGEIDQSFIDGADGYMLKSNLTPRQLVENVEKIFTGQTVGIRKRQMEIEKKKNNLALKQSLEQDALVKDKTGDFSTVKDNGIAILLIEDEEAIIDMYKLRLEKEGIRVEVAKNGAWGLKLAKEKDFDIIVMDMVMPAMNGYDAIKELKKNNKTKAVPIIVLSNSAQEEDIAEAKKLGAAVYLLKSQITPAKLVGEIRKVLGMN